MKYSKEGSYPGEIKNILMDGNKYTVKQIYNKLIENKFKINTKTPEKSISKTLNRRNDLFVKVENGVYRLKTKDDENTQISMIEKQNKDLEPYDLTTLEIKNKNSNDKLLTICKFSGKGIKKNADLVYLKCGHIMSRFFRENNKIDKCVECKKDINVMYITKNLIIKK